MKLSFAAALVVGGLSISGCTGAALVGATLATDANLQAVQNKLPSMNCTELRDTNAKMYKRTRAGATAAIDPGYGRALGIRYASYDLMKSRGCKLPATGR
ncbi:MAG: hypothetical protein AAF429_12450 [Pseudomonadota bacterium]